MNKKKFTIVVVVLTLVAMLAGSQPGRKALDSTWQKLTGLISSPERKVTTNNDWKRISFAEAEKLKEEFCPLDFKTEVSAYRYTIETRCKGVIIKIVNGEEAWVKKT